MHVVGCDVDFTVTIPIPKECRTIPPEFTRTYSKFSDAFIVSCIILDSDRFYNPRVPCRRLFTMKGVDKIYPTVYPLKQKNDTFLHKGKHQFDDNSFTYRRSISLINANVAYNELGYFPSQNIKFITEEFIFAEKIYASEMCVDLEFFTCTDENASQKRVERLKLLEQPFVKSKRSKRNSGVKNSRYSFPIPNTLNTVSW